MTAFLIAFAVVVWLVLAAVGAYSAWSGAKQVKFRDCETTP